MKLSDMCWGLFYTCRKIELAPVGAVKQIVVWNYLTRAHARCNELLTVVMLEKTSTCSSSDGNAGAVRSTYRLLLNPGQSGNGSRM